MFPYFHFTLDSAKPDKPHTNLVAALRFSQRLSNFFFLYKTQHNTLRLRLVAFVFLLIVSFYLSWLCFQISIQVGKPHPSLLTHSLTHSLTHTLLLLLFLRSFSFSFFFIASEIFLYKKTRFWILGLEPCNDVMLWMLDTFFSPQIATSLSRSSYLTCFFFKWTSGSALQVQCACCVSFFSWNHKVPVKVSIFLCFHHVGYWFFFCVIGGQNVHGSFPFSYLSIPGYSLIF